MKDPLDDDYEGNEIRIGQIVKRWDIVELLPADDGSTYEKTRYYLQQVNSYKKINNYKLYEQGEKTFRAHSFPASLTESEACRRAVDFVKRACNEQD